MNYLVGVAADGGGAFGHLLGLGFHPGCGVVDFFWGGVLDVFVTFLAADYPTVGSFSEGADLAIGPGECSGEVAGGAPVTSVHEECNEA